MSTQFEKDIEWARDTPTVLRAVKLLKFVKQKADSGDKEAKQDYETYVLAYKHQARADRNYFSGAILKAVGESYESPPEQTTV